MSAFRGLGFSVIGLMRQGCAVATLANEQVLQTVLCTSFLPTMGPYSVMTFCSASFKASELLSLKVTR